MMNENNEQVVNITEESIQFPNLPKMQPPELQFTLQLSCYAKLLGQTIKAAQVFATTTQTTKTIRQRRYSSSKTASHML